MNITRLDKPSAKYWCQAIAFTHGELQLSMYYTNVKSLTTEVM